MKTISISQICPSRGFQKHAVLMLSFASLAGCFQSAFAQPPVPSPRPVVAPLIGDRYPNDADKDRVDDGLLGRAQLAVAAEKIAPTPQEKTAARAKLDEMVAVELVFKQPVTQQQIDRFITMGGEISYIYKAVSYGWNGRIPLKKITGVPAAMGATLILLNEGHVMKGDMDEATANTRVRPVWASGFAGSSSGFAGTTNITIAFIDSGVDETHMDLAGRGVYSSNFTDEASPATVDLVGHGSHVAGIALGTGAAAGISGALFFTTYDDLYHYGTNILPAGGGYLYPLHLPVSSATLTMTAKWLGGASTTFNRYSRNNGDINSADWSIGQGTSGASPLTLSQTAAFNPIRAFAPSVLSVGGPGISNYVITAVVSNYPAIDTFNRLRGVAPGCNWASAKTLRSDDTGSDLWTSAALDDLVAKRTEKNIKVINISQTLASGINAALRQKINSTVLNGILVVTGTGNTGKSGNPADQQARDPSRAALALTLCAANDVNQVTDYTSTGFSSPDSTPGQEEDYKPDLMAPGGSAYYSFIMSVDSNNNDGPAFADQRTNDYTGMKGTSMSVPFGSGAAALVIEAMERSGVQWDFNSGQHSRYVKMLLCATASESNTNRELNFNNPTLQRASSITNGSEVLPPGKDLYEGYGMLNADAAVEAATLTYTNGTLVSNTLGSTVSDRRVWARTVPLFAGRNFRVALTNPATGDFDLYLYSANPSAYGTPVLLASSTQAGVGISELLNYTPGADQSALLIVKRVSGSGTFTLTGNAAPTIDFTVDVGSGTAPLSVQFTNLTTSATNYAWSFGDGNFSALANPANVYALPGNYTVTLTAIGPGGTNTLTRAGYIVVTSAPPIADFAAAVTNGFVPLEVTFTNLSTDATNYAWDFGDGQSSTERQPTHTFVSPGIYTISLTAMGAGGSITFSREAYIIAAGVPVLSAISATPADFTFSFETLPGKTYFIEYKDSLDDSAWQTLQSIPGDGGLNTVTSPISAMPQRFFRLRVE
ncbi:MAG TPA: S8 family serine peptidase [Candidatus Dormibacteraeota bacterium]|nr:S8 family serine peptidase [Candidatus Dormibacteraeota bacterium]